MIRTGTPCRYYVETDQQKPVGHLSGQIQIISPYNTYFSDRCSGDISLTEIVKKKLIHRF
jgi:hypothetical protein